MNLIARRTEQAIKLAARRELRRDATTWGEFKRRRQRVKPLVWKGFAVVGLLFLSAAPLVGLMRMSALKGAGWSAFILFVLMSLLVTMLVQHILKRAALLERLPIADRDIFRCAWREHLLTSLLLLPGFLVFVHLFSRERGAMWLESVAAAALLLATLQAALCVAVVWGRAAQWAPWVGSLGVSLAWIGMLMSGDDGSPLIRMLLDQMCELVRNVTPSGWVLNWRLERAHGEANAALWLTPVAVVIGLAFPAWRRMRDTFVVPESAPRLPQLTPVQQAQLNYAAKHFPPSGPLLAGVTAIEESLRARRFLAHRRRPQPGILDEWVWRWLTERERVLMDLLQLVPADWTRLWQRGLMAGAVGLVLTPLLRASQPEAYWLAGAIAGAIMGAITLPVTTGLQRAFLPCPVAGGAPMTLAGVVPMSYREVFILDLKISVLRALTALPLVLVFGAVFAFEVVGSPGLGLFIAVKVCIGSLLLRPLMVSSLFSMGTNDSQLTKLRGWFMLAIILFVVLSCLPSGVAALAFPQWWSLPLLFLPGLIAYAFHRFHRRRYDQMGFDLQPSTLLGQHPVG